MTSHFVAASCNLEGDAFVNNLLWSKVDPIAAMAVSTIDTDGRENHQVLFIAQIGLIQRVVSKAPGHTWKPLKWEPL